MNPSRSPGSPPSARPSTGSARSPPAAARPHPAAVSLPVIPVGSRSGQRRDGERERSPQLVESKPRRGEEGERLTRARGGKPDGGRGRPRRKGGTGAEDRRAETARRFVTVTRALTSSGECVRVREEALFYARTVTLLFAGLSRERSRRGTTGDDGERRACSSPVPRRFSPIGDRLRARTPPLDRGASHVARIQCSRETTQERRRLLLCQLTRGPRPRPPSGTHLLRDELVHRRARSR